MHYNTNINKCKDLCSSKKWCTGFEMVGNNNDTENGEVCTLKEKIDGYDIKFNYFQKVKGHQEEEHIRHEEHEIIDTSDTADLE